MRETPDVTPADAEIKRIAGGAVGTAVFLLGLGAVWWFYSIVYALTTLPHGNPEYLNTSEGFSPPWQMPFAVFAIPCAVAALALLITGMRLQRPRESAWLHANLSRAGFGHLCQRWHGAVGGAGTDAGRRSHHGPRRGGIDARSPRIPLLADGHLRLAPAQRSLASIRAQGMRRPGGPGQRSKTPPDTSPDRGRHSGRSHRRAGVVEAVAPSGGR